MNIVSLIMNFLAPSLVGRVASAIGIEGGLAQKAIQAAIPSILSGIVGATSKPDGARQFSDLVSKQDSGLLGNLGNLLTGQAQASLVSNGTNLLSSVLGQGSLSSLTSAIAKHAGIGDFASKSLLGMLGPVVAGVLGKEQKAQNLDAMGLAKMLAGQKENIANAMPNGFAQLLGGTNLLDSVSSQLKTQVVDTTTAAKAAASPSQAPATSAPQSVDRRPPISAPPMPRFNWWPWLLAIAASSLLFYNTFINVPPRPIIQPVSQPRAPDPVKIMAGSTDVGAQVSTTMGSILTSVRSVRDEATARAALPALQNAQRDVDRLSELARTGLQPEARRALAGLVNEQLPVIQPAVTTALAAPGASGVLKAVLDAVVARLAALGKV
ncbi:MAG: hypothetical protein RL291_1146 [Pseudomonadota bacterium]